jgi:hypothetical protein
MLKEIASTGQDGEEEYPELRETLTRLLTIPAAGSASVSPAITAMTALPDLELISPPEPFTPAALPVAKICSVQSAIPEPQPTTVLRQESDASPNKPSLERIGGLLVERGQAQESDIVLALEDQRRGDRRRLGEILIARGSVKPEDVFAAQQTLEARARDAAPESIRV